MGCRSWRWVFSVLHGSAQTVMFACPPSLLILLLASVIFIESWRHSWRSCFLVQLQTGSSNLILRSRRYENERRRTTVSYSLQLKRSNDWGAKGGTEVFWLCEVNSSFNMFISWATFQSINFLLPFNHIIDLTQFSCLSPSIPASDIFSGWGSKATAKNAHLFVCVCVNLKKKQFLIMNLLKSSTTISRVWIF